MDAVVRIIVENMASSELAAVTTDAQQAAQQVTGLSGSMETGAQASAQASKSLIDYAAQLIGVKEIVAGAVVALGAMEAAYLSNSIETQKLATMSGTTVEAFSKIKGAAEDIGVSGETVQHSLVLMQRGMEASGEQGEAFRESLRGLGVETDNYKGSATGTTDMLLALQSQFSKMPDGPEKTAAAMKVFGRGGAEMLEFLGQSDEALASNMKAFDSLGQTVTNADVQIARDVRNVKNDIMDLAESASTAIARGMAPMFLEAMTAIGKAADDAFHGVVDQFGGVKGATEALKQSLETLRPVLAAIGPVASAAFEAMRGFAGTLTGIASIAPLAASGFYELAAGCAAARGASDEVVEGYRASAAQMAEMSERGVALSEAMFGIGETAAVAGPRMTDHANATKAATEAMGSAATGLGGYTDAAKKATGEAKDFDKATREAVKSALGMSNEAKKGAMDALDASHKAQQARYDEIQSSRVSATASRECATAVASEAHEIDLLNQGFELGKDWVREYNAEMRQTPACLGDINAGINAMAAGLSQAANEAAALQKSITDAVYAQSSLKPITAGQAMGPAGGATRIGNYTIELPQQGLPGAAGMQAAENYQIAVANAQALTEAKRRNEEQAAMAAKLGYGKDSDKIKPTFAGAAEMSARMGGGSGGSNAAQAQPPSSWTPGSWWSPDDWGGDPGRITAKPGMARDLAEYQDFQDALARGASDPRYSSAKKLQQQQSGRTGVDYASTLPKEMDAPKVAPAASGATSGGGAASVVVIDYQKLADILAASMSNVRIMLGMREVGQALLDGTMKGQTMIYAPAGSTKVR